MTQNPKVKHGWFHDHQSSVDELLSTPSYQEIIRNKEMAKGDSLDNEVLRYIPKDFEMINENIQYIDQGRFNTARDEKQDNLVVPRARSNENPYRLAGHKIPMLRLKKEIANATTSMTIRKIGPDPKLMKYGRLDSKLDMPI